MAGRVSDGALKSFAAGLDFLALGRAFGKWLQPDNAGRRRSPLPILMWAARNRGFGRVQARAFVEGWGLANIRLVVQTFLSPDCLSVLFDLLQSRCGYRHEKLAQEQLNPASPSLWLRAFAEHPASTGSNIPRMQQRPFAEALAAFRANVTPQVWPTLDLRHWNILHHNLGLADPALPESLLWPRLIALPEARRDRLLADADLFNLSLFLGRFGPEGVDRNPRLPGHLPEVPALLAIVRTGTLLDFAHLLLNLWWVGAEERAAGVVAALCQTAGALPADLAEADLRTMSFLLWTAWLAVPEGDWLVSGAFADALNARLGVLDLAGRDHLADWLGIAGVLALSSQPLPQWDNLAGADVAHAEKALRGTLAARDAELIRRLAGSFARFGDALTADFRFAAVSALGQVPQRPEIEPQERARAQVMAG